MVSSHNSMVWRVDVRAYGQMENRHRHYLPIKKILDGSGLAMQPWQSTDLWERMKNSSNIQMDNNRNNIGITVVII